MFDTRNDLPANTRTKVIELLNARLADAIDLGPDLFTGISRDNDTHLHAKR